MKFLYFIALIFCFHNLSVAQEAEKLKLKSGEVFFEENTKMLFENHLNENEFLQNIYCIIQFHRIPDALTLQSISNSGINLTEYLGLNSYLCWFKKSDYVTIKNIREIRSMIGLNSQLKVSPSLKKDFLTKRNSKNSRHQIKVKIYPDIETRLFIQEIIPAGLFLTKIGNDSDVLTGNLTEDQIMILASYPVVIFIEKPSPRGEKEDTGARVLHRTNNIDQNFENGLKYDGSGVNVLVRDDGKIGPHIDYKGRVDQSNASGISSFSTHGDMVSGILIGAGNLNPDVTGTAKGAFLYLTDYESDFMDETMDLYYKKNVVITSSSYSDGCNDGYTINSLTTDKQIYENPDLIHVFSAGNSGGLDCNYGAGPGWGNITGGHKMGKNSIAVGNLNQDGIIESSSSRGPATDGRIKPDICANGAGQLSTYPNNTIDFGGGTSAAAPGISGVLAQLIQAYKNLNNNEIPSSALMKATLLNTATDLGTKGPDFVYGWGQVNARRAYELIKDKRFQKISISQNDEKEISLEVPENSSSLRVMIYWADKESSLLSTQALVNDVDMKITKPDGGVSLPYTLDHSQNSTLLASPATNGIDHLNNMEQVEINNPNPGKYTIQLSGYQIPFQNIDVWLVYEITNAEPFLVYPNGGESFNQSEPIKIQWDAEEASGDFTMDYTTDNGKSWNFIKTVSGNLRKTIWDAPAIPTDSIFLRINRNGKSHVTQAPFTILNQIDTLFIDNICPDSATIHWKKIEGATKYVLFDLKAKYMEPFDTVSTNNATFSNYPGFERWISVMPITGTGMKGKRCVAKPIYKLFNCVQAIDLSVLPDTSLVTSKIFCEESVQIFKAVLKNEGSDTIEKITIHYKTGENDIKSKLFEQSIIPGKSIEIEFDTLLVSKNYNIDVRLWCDAPGETARYNDTLQFHVDYQVQNPTGTVLPYQQDFENEEFPPNYWTVVTNDIQVNWDTISCVGSSGKLTKAAWMNNFNNILEGSFDDLVTQKFNLLDETEAFLSFDYAYTRFDQDYNDSLKVEISINCGESYDETLFYDGGSTLQTVSDMDEIFVPDSPKQWKTIYIDLKNYLGQIPNFRFRNISGYGNSLLLDNIRVVNKIKPEAVIIGEVEKYCVGISKPLEFYAKYSPNSTYLWDFGEGSIPKSESGQGPHLVSYSTPGTKQIKLKVATITDADSVFIELDASPLTDAKFSYNKNGKTIEFIPIQQGANTKHLWNFGDGSTSMDMQPIHTFQTGGNFNVTHNLTDDCGTDFQNENVLITSTQSNNLRETTIYPNPATRELNIQSETPIEGISLYNLLGKCMYAKTSFGPEGWVKIDVSNYPDGLYFLNVQVEGKIDFQKVEIIKN